MAQNYLYNIPRYQLEAKKIKGFGKITGKRLFDTKKIELIGNCCVTIYNGYNFGGNNKQLLLPAEGIWEIQDFGLKVTKIRSFKFGYCNDDVADPFRERTVGQK